MILASQIDDTAIIILKDGTMIDDTNNDYYYYIDENNKIYKLVDWVDDDIAEGECNFIVAPIEASVYTSAGNHYQYDESSAELVYVVNDELSYYGN